jgi:hypothetical protein
MGKLVILSLLIIFMTACATSRETFTPDGRIGHSINCSGSVLHWGKCFEKAGEICGEKGYEVIARSGDQGSMIAANQFGLYGESVTTRSLVVQCKN